MGWTEWLIILAVAAVLYRPRQLGRTLGRAAGDASASFRDGVREGAAAGGSGRSSAGRSGSAASGGSAARGGAEQAARDAQRAAAALQRTRLLAVLELPPAATAEDVRRAWRDLAKVWHPDRFANDPALQARATARLAAINAAYDELQRAAPSA